MTGRAQSKTGSAWLALAGGLSLAIAGCSPADNDAAEPAAEAASDRTVASILAGEERFSAIAEVLAETGVASAFDGSATYTVFAPTDDALSALPAADTQVGEQERRVFLIALLRSHIVPGEVTPATIRQALDASGGPVEMRNLAGGLLTFTLDGDTVRVAGQDGNGAAIEGDTLIGSNGTVIPVDGALAPLSGDN